MVETTPSQRVKRVSVKGLFGMYDHDVPLNLEERVTLVYGLNGSGKTTMLKMLSYAQANRLDELELDFKSFTVEPVDGEPIHWVPGGANPQGFAVPVVYDLSSLPSADCMVRRSIKKARNSGGMSRFDNKAARFLGRLNSRLMNKTANLSPEGDLRILDARDRPIGVLALSEGERSLITRTALSIFGMKAGGLLLLDEPEQSTHLSWQQEVVPDLLEDADEGGFDVIITTHSPDIIGAYEHLAVGLSRKVS